MSSSIDHHLIKKSIEIFKNSDHYQSHDNMRCVLTEMAQDETFFDAMVKFNFNNIDFLKRNQKIPVIDFNIASERQFTLSAHCWLPWKDRAINRSANWIHHHDNSLLTSINSYGNNIGYHSFNFNTDYEIDESTNEVYNLKVTKEFHHPYLNIEFCDVYVPHVVYKPADLMITYALWSYDKPVLMDGLRSNPIVQAIKKPAKKIINMIKAEKMLEIETETDHRQFAPNEKGGFSCVGNIQYPESTNENFIHNSIWILKETGYKNEKYLNELKAKFNLINISNHNHLIDNILNNTAFDLVEAPNHINNKGINFSIESLIAAAKYSPEKSLS
jgi:hypothetical protein